MGHFLSALYFQSRMAYIGSESIYNDNISVGLYMWAFNSCPDFVCLFNTHINDLERTTTNRCGRQYITSIFYHSTVITSYSNIWGAWISQKKWSNHLLQPQKGPHPPGNRRWNDVHQIPPKSGIPSHQIAPELPNTRHEWRRLEPTTSSTTIAEEHASKVPTLPPAMGEMGHLTNKSH